MKIEYGIENKYEDVTQFCLNNFVKNANLIITDNYIARSHQLNRNVDEHTLNKKIKITYNNNTFHFENDVFLKFRLIDIYYSDGKIGKDITNYVIKNFINDNYINIPKDTNLNISDDPFPNDIEKYLVIIYFGEQHFIKFEDNFSFNVEKLKINKTKINNKILNESVRLNDIQNRLNIVYGNKYDEYDEQYMAVKYLQPTDVVLELGSNIGRNSCIISSILKDSSNLVTLETDKYTCVQLNLNRELNGYKFHIVNKALSYIPLIQSTWRSEVQLSNEMKENYYKVDTITYEELCEGFNLKFNTLVLDCEGAIYYILQSNESILKDFDKIIIENDFLTIEEKNYVDSLFEKYNFKEVFSMPLINFPELFIGLRDKFYQTFIKQKE